MREEVWLLLHDLRLRGRADTQGSGDYGLLEARGWVARRDRFVVVTPAGREVHARWARVEAGSGAESALVELMRRFEVLNEELLSICTAWQLTPSGAVNDHADPSYDWAVIDRLRALDERAGPVVRHAASAAARFGAYRRALGAAFTRVDAGEPEWLASPRIDSYHTVWMRLHEDLLLALGRSRDDESRSRTPG